MSGDPLWSWSDLTVYAVTGLVMLAALCAGIGYESAAAVLGVVALAVVVGAASS